MNLSLSQEECEVLFRIVYLFVGSCYAIRRTTVRRAGVYSNRNLLKPSKIRGFDNPRVKNACDARGRFTLKLVLKSAANRNAASHSFHLASVLANFGDLKTLVKKLEYKYNT
jgi:hypothetical protein